MTLTRFQRNANEEHFINALSMINDGGYYCWKDQQQAMLVKNNKYNLTLIQYEKIYNIYLKCYKS